MKQWQVYIVRCAKGSLYTGITTDIARRLSEHNGAALGESSGDSSGESPGKGAKYLRGRGPVVLVWQCCLPNRSEASKLEIKIKQLSRTRKEALIAGKLELI